MKIRRAVVRLAATGVLLAAAGLVVVQFARMIGENVALQRTLVRTQADVRMLRAKRDHEARQVARLREVDGSIPAIHERLGEVGPHEAIIYLKDAPTPQPTSADLGR